MTRQSYVSFVENYVWPLLSVFTERNWRDLSTQDVERTQRRLVNKITSSQIQDPAMWDLAELGKYFWIVLDLSKDVDYKMGLGLGKKRWEGLELYLHGKLISGELFWTIDDCVGKIIGAGLGDSRVNQGYIKKNPGKYIYNNFEQFGRNLWDLLKYIEYAGLVTTVGISDDNLYDLSNMIHDIHFPFKTSVQKVTVYEDLIESLNRLLSNANDNKSISKEYEDVKSTVVWMLAQGIDSPLYRPTEQYLWDTLDKSINKVKSILAVP